MPQSKKFLIFSQYFPPEIGATQSRMQALARVLTQLGHEVEVVTALPHHLQGQIFEGYRGRFYLREQRGTTTVHRTWVYASPDARVSKRLLNYGSFVCTSIAGLWHANRPDFLFVQSPPLFTSLPAGLFSWLRRTPTILDIADLWPKSVRMLGVMRQGVALRAAEKLENWAYRRARYINAVTQGIYQELAIDRKLKDKVLFLPNGVDTETFSPRLPDDELLDRFGLRGKKVLIYAGTHGLAYRLDMLVRVAASLASLNVVLMLVGDGHTKGHLAELIARDGCAKNVILVDSQPEEVLPRFSTPSRALL